VVRGMPSPRRAPGSLAGVGASTRSAFGRSRHAGLIADHKNAPDMTLKGLAGANEATGAPLWSGRPYPVNPSWLLNLFSRGGSGRVGCAEELTERTSLTSRSLIDEMWFASRSDVRRSVGRIVTGTRDRARAGGGVTAEAENESVSVSDRIRTDCSTAEGREVTVPQFVRRGQTPRCVMAAQRTVWPVGGARNASARRLSGVPEIVDREGDTMAFDAEAVAADGGRRRTVSCGTSIRGR